MERLLQLERESDADRESPEEDVLTTQSVTGMYQGASNPESVPKEFREAFLRNLANLDPENVNWEAELALLYDLLFRE